MMGGDMSDLYLIFNHQLTEIQANAAVTQLKIRHIHTLPDGLQALWSRIPPELTSLTAYLEPIGKWLADQARPSDFVLIQGDFGACCRMVAEAFRLNLIPLYSTTKREAIEEHHADGTVELTHRFRHIIFRKYEC
jgi:hypothetical protein